MSSLHNLKPDRVIKAFERAGWKVRKQTGSPYILSIPVHKRKPIKQGLLRDQIAKAGLTVEEFLELYK